MVQFFKTYNGESSGRAARHFDSLAEEVLVLAPSISTLRDVNVMQVSGIALPEGQESTARFLEES